MAPWHPLRNEVEAWPRPVVRIMHPVPVIRVGYFRRSQNGKNELRIAIMDKTRTPQGSVHGTEFESR